MKYSKYIFYTILSFMSSAVFAGEGFYVTFHNNSNYPILIKPAGNDNWNLGDFGHNNNISPHTTARLYTEAKSDMTYTEVGIVGIDYCPVMPDGVTILSNDCPHLQIWENPYQPLNANQITNAKSSSYEFDTVTYTFNTWVSKDQNAITDFYHSNDGFHIDVNIQPRDLF